MSEVFAKKPIKIVEIPLMTAGLCGYGDRGNIYISDSTMYKIMPKLLGISVILTHEGTDPIGEVVDVFQNPSDTDQWIGKLAIRDEDVVSKLASGWGVSTAYKIVRETEEAGKWNNIDYDSEVLDVDWLHVAVVDNPRYTIAKDGVFLNSAKKKGEQMFNLFRIKREKVLLNEDEKLFVKVGDEELELSEIIKKVSEEEIKNKKNFASDDMEVELNGEKICVKELIDRYNACKKNEEEKKEEVKEEEEKKEEIKNEDKEEDKKDEDKKENEEEKVEEKKEEEKVEEKKNEEEKKEEIKKEEEKKEEIKNSLDVKQAYLNRGVEVDFEYKTMSERIALANKKYGTAK